MNYLLTFLSHLWAKVVEIAKIPVAWLWGLGLFIADAFAGGKPILYVVVIASIVDLICGISVALKRKTFAKSELMKQTVEKLVVYGAAMLIFLCIDHAVEQKTDFAMDITSGLVGSVIAVIEAWSSLALLLILFPENPFLCLFQKALTGELARKLGCDEKEVAKILNNSRKSKKQMRAKNGRFEKGYKKTKKPSCGPLKDGDDKSINGGL